MTIGKILRVADGNIGAVRLAASLPESALDTCLRRGITGPRLWLCYKDLGGEGMERLIANIESEDIGDKLTALGYAPEVPRG